jgi:hypothetical protein
VDYVCDYRLIPVKKNVINGDIISKVQNMKGKRSGLFVTIWCEAASVLKC